MPQISFEMNYCNLYEIDLTPNGMSRTWARVGAGINAVEWEGNEEVSQDPYYDGDGMSSSDVTGGQLVGTFEGHRKYGDPAQDYIAGMLLDYGEGRKTNFKWIAPDGQTLTGEVTIANIMPQGGDPNAKSDFSFEVHFNGMPTLEAVRASEAPTSIEAQPVTVGVGGLASIVATVMPEGAAPALAYEVEDDSIADVTADGVVKGVANGTTRVRVKSLVRPLVNVTVEVTVGDGGKQPEVSVTATAPTGGEIGWGDKTFEDLGILDVSTQGTKITLSGTLNHVEEWPEFSSSPADLTGYYAAMFLQGEGYIGKTMATNEWKVVPVADCHDGWIMAVKKDQKSFTFKLFATEEEAKDKENGVEYTVDLSGVTYAG